LDRCDAAEASGLGPFRDAAQGGIDRQRRQLPPARTYGISPVPADLPQQLELTLTERRDFLRRALESGRSSRRSVDLSNILCRCAAAPNTMAKLIYSAIMSLDGYVADEDGNFDWAAPDEEVHAYVNDLERPVGTYLYGRRMYEVMRYWETAPTGTDQAPAEKDYATIWQAADKIVYSRTLPTVTTARTRIERDFDPEAVRQLKTTALRDLSVGGTQVAAQAIAAGLVDELQLFIVPIVVGGGTAALPDKVRVKLELLDEHRFRSGVVYLHYRTRR
jgi:dihydrofolate reductase